MSAAAFPMVRLADLCEFKPPKSLAKRALPDDALVSFVPMNDLGELRMDFQPSAERPLAEVFKSYTYFADGDVICAKITPCFENGKMGLAAGLRNGVGFGSSEFVVMRASPRLLAQYLFYYMLRDDFREAGAKVMTGAVGHKRVPNEFFEQLKVPMPPLEEQKRIVAVLDQAFAALDRARALAEANLADGEEFFDSWASDAFRLDGVDRPTVYLPDISENLDRSRVPITKADRKPGNVPYYGASGEVDRVADFIFDEDLLLVSEDGANLLARTYPIAFSISGKSWVNNHAHVLRFENPTDQEYVRLYLNSIPLDDFVSGMAQPKLNQKALNSIPIPFPPGEERARIVEKAAEISAASVAAMGLYDAQFTDVAELRQSLLQTAFAGALT